jgi:general stress protein CsbA
MEENKDYERDLASIRNIMERSAKFISLSGLSGVLAGVYALFAAVYAYQYIYWRELAEHLDGFTGTSYHLIITAVITLVASLATGFWLSYQKAKRLGQSIWNSTSRKLIMNLLIPLAAGGVFVLMMLWYGYIGLVAPACLLFYGLALLNASQNLFTEIRYLAYCEIVLGLVATAYMGYGLFFWALGFGVLHIIYGALMYRKYDS